MTLATRDYGQGQSSLSFAIALVFLVLYVVVWAICLLGLRTAQYRYAGKALPSRLANLPPKSVPGISIIRPLCGLDNNLYNTLESVMKLEYPKYEVIFALQDEHDEAIPVVKMILDKFPTIPARIIISDTDVGVNPKINNLITPFTEATYDLVWVLDATIAMQPDSLGRMVDAFVGYPVTSSLPRDVESTPLLGDDVREPPAKGDVGLVHHVPYAIVFQKTWGSMIEQAFLNTTHAKMYLAINATAIDSCVVGKSNLYSRANVSSLTTPSPSLRAASATPPTGLAAFSPFLAEDNMIALGLWHELGLKHAMTSDVALDFISNLSISGYIARRVRWLRVRKRMTLAATLLEPFTESILAATYGTWAISRIFGATKSALFLLHMILWLLVDLGVKSSLGTRVSGVGPPTSFASFILAWLAREIMALPIWIWAMLSDTVVWRGRRYRILSSGEAARI